MAKSNKERQAAYREKHLKAEDATKSRLNIVISDRAILALKRLAKKQSLNQAALLERLLLDEDMRVTAEMNDEEYTAYRDSVTA